MTLPPISIQICCSLISLLNVSWRSFYFHQHSLDNTVYLSLEFLNSEPFLILISSFCPLELLYKLLVFDLYSIFFNSAIFVDLLFLSLNSFFSLVRKSSTIENSNSLLSKYFIKFFFWISTNPPCIYDSTHYTCCSTIISCILITK